MADISINAANVAASSTAVTSKQYNFGATVTAGQPVYLDSNNKWQLIDQNAAVTGNNITDIRGIAQCNGAANQPAAVCLEDSDFTPGGTLTNGMAVYASANAGGITMDVPGSGNYPVFLGLAKSTTKMVLRPVAGGTAV